MKVYGKEYMHRIEIYQGWCKKCGICVAFCSKHVLEAGKEAFPVVKNPEKCTGCKLCEIRCPDFAIVVSKDEKRKARPDSSAGQ